VILEINDMIREIYLRGIVIDGGDILKEFKTFDDFPKHKFSDLEGMNVWEH
jgi:hypothetical protein